MVLRSRLISDDEREVFDSFVAGHSKGHVLQTFAWGQVKSHTGWYPLRLVVEEDDRIVASISVLKRRIPFLGKSIFYAPRGPVADMRDRETLGFLFQEVRRLARLHNSILLKIDPDIPAGDRKVLKNLELNGFRRVETGKNFEGVQPKYVFRLDITPDEEKLLASFHPKTRYNIRLAGRKGVRIINDCKKKDLAVFYKILLETARRDRFLVRSFDYFNVLWEDLVARGYAKLFLAKYQGKIIAGTLAFILGEKAWYIYGASSNYYRNVMPNYLLQWSMILWAKEKGCKIYDFRGVSGDLSKDNPLYGLYRFKKGFNGKFTEFIGEMDLPYSPLAYRLWTTARPVLSRSLKTLVALQKKLTARGGNRLG